MLFFYFFLKKCKIRTKIVFRLLVEMTLKITVSIYLQFYFVALKVDWFEAITTQHSVPCLCKEKESGSKQWQVNFSQKILSHKESFRNPLVFPRKSLYKIKNIAQTTRLHINIPLQKKGLPETKKCRHDINTRWFYFEDYTKHSTVLTCQHKRFNCYRHHRNTTTSKM